MKIGFIVCLCTNIRLILLLSNWYNLCTVCLYDLCTHLCTHIHAHSNVLLRKDDNYFVCRLVELWLIYMETATLFIVTLNRQTF